MYKLALKKVQRIFFQNSENMDFFKKHHIQTEEKYCLLPGSGVNLDKFHVVEYPNDDVIKFVFIARIMKEKGIEQYLEAAKYVKERYPNTEFHICGFCEQDYSNILKQYSDSNIVIYHGQVQDIRTILKDMHCTIHPSYYPEGMSNVLLESCAMGKPIITTDRAGCREIVEDGINGYVCKIKDSYDLINKIQSFLDLSPIEKKEMGLHGRKKVEKEFDRNIIIDALLRDIKNYD